MRTASRIANLPPYLFAEIDRKKEAKQAQGIDVISLGIGDPDTPTPDHIVDAMARAIRDPKNHQYPSYFGAKRYREAAAEWMRRRFGVDVDPATEVLALIGSKEGIAHVFLAFVDPGDYTLVPGAGYPVYHTGGILSGGQSWFMPMTEENGFLADFESTPPEVLAKAKMMFLSYPNNPTSAIATEEYFDRAIAFAREHDLLLIHDNAYSEIGFDGYRAPSILERPGAKDVAIELFSLSKAYNMTGWRVAFAAGNAQAIKALGTVKSNIDSGVFTAIQDAAIEALLGPQDSIQELCALYQRRRDLVIDTLHRIGLHAQTPKATIYVWARVPEGYTSATFAEKVLDEANVIVAPGNAYGPSGEGYVRISLTTPDDRLEEALERIKNTL
ncbi:LL-diaminopimelate aminotransferase [Coriobacteriia bacterium Es71-Z0120]|uniref:LL-diaminopimelate aminotransferase n=1 Tax=Parvivirga hydrogeniphila TaxID=2939460 RepID=UPI002260C72F|nr:LL-diaminopimelate aminotransferase [Parvivirga hydrogeniphila]MCL4079630.1 LL-diaminopimelate aminotransferase [Parvivirga hydrogeniphila]